MNSQVLCFLGLQPVRPRVHCGIYISGDQRRDHATGGAPALEDDDELELLCEEAGALALEDDDDELELLCEEAGALALEDDDELELLCEEEEEDDDDDAPATLRLLERDERSTGSMMRRRRHQKLPKEPFAFVPRYLHARTSKARMRRDAPGWSTTSNVT